MSEPTHFYLRPVKGRLVRDPNTQAPLSAEGVRKPRNTYWVRRLRAGDVVELPTMTVEETRIDG